MIDITSLDELSHLVTEYATLSSRIDSLSQEREQALANRSEILDKLRTLGGKDKTWTIPSLGLTGARIVQRGETLFFRGGRRNVDNEIVITG
jgi:hypothetical protein